MSRWAKAPEHRDPEATLADTREFLESGLAPVRCSGCASEVLVRKSSHYQTSVQWRSDPAASCPEFAARVAAGEVSARIDTCPKLRESIEHAVAAGAVTVPSSASTNARRRAGAEHAPREDGSSADERSDQFNDQ